MGNFNECQGRVDQTYQTVKYRDSRTPLLGKVSCCCCYSCFCFFFQGKLLRFVVVCQLSYNRKKRYLNHVKKRMFWNLTIQFIILSTSPLCSLHMTKLYFVTRWLYVNWGNRFQLTLNLFKFTSDFEVLLVIFLAYPSKYSPGGEVR